MQQTSAEFADGSVKRKLKEKILAHQGSCNVLGQLNRNILLSNCKPKEQSTQCCLKLESDSTQDRLKDLLSKSLIDVCQNEVDFSQLLTMEANVKIICDRDKVYAFNLNEVLIRKNTEMDEFDPPPKKKFAQDHSLEEKEKKKKMHIGKNCAVKNCPNYSNEWSRSTGITFHRFPMNRENRNRWESNVRIFGQRGSEWVATQWSTICSLHFESDCFDRSGPRVLLRKDALPTLFEDQKNSNLLDGVKESSIAFDGVQEIQDLSLQNNEKFGINCSVVHCPNHANGMSRTIGITFHEFPEDSDIRNQWESNVRRFGRKSEWQSSQWSHLCSLHFEADCFDRTGSRVCLTKDALPTVFKNQTISSSDSSPEECIEECEIAVECINGSEIASECFKESEIAVVCFKESQIADECVVNGQIKDDECVVGEMTSTLKTKKFPRKKRKHFLLEHNYAICETLPTMKRKLNVCLERCSTMKCKIKVYHQRELRWRKRKETFESLMLELRTKERLHDQSAEAIEASFSQEAACVIQRQLSRCQKKLSCNKYPEELKRFALTLQGYSGKAYDYVRQIFGNGLPHPQTLTKWHNCVNGEPGIGEQMEEAELMLCDDWDGQEWVVMQSF